LPLACDSSPRSTPCHRDIFVLATGQYSDHAKVESPASPRMVQNQSVQRIPPSSAALPPRQPSGRAIGRNQFGRSRSSLKLGLAKKEAWTRGGSPTRASKECFTDHLGGDHRLSRNNKKAQRTNPSSERNQVEAATVAVA